MAGPNIRNLWSDGVGYGPTMGSRYGDDAATVCTMGAVHGHDHFCGQSSLEEPELLRTAALLQHHGSSIILERALEWPLSI